jgi:hypothetical protein
MGPLHNSGSATRRYPAGSRFGNPSATKPGFQAGSRRTQREQSKNGSASLVWRAPIDGAQASNMKEESYLMSNAFCVCLHISGAAKPHPA